jgi:Ca-activated chloride channel homolog
MSKLFIYVLSFLFSFSFAQDKGIELFNDKKYSEAIEYYKKVLEQRKGDAAAELGLGSSAYYNDNIDQALRSFEEASKSDNEIIQSKALYNIARILQDKDEISKSLKLYKKALELNPSDVDTKINYELLKKMKNEEQQENQDQEGSQEQQENQDQEGSQEQQENQDQEGSSADNIEKEKSDQMIQAEAILNALKGQEEINQKQKILKSKILKYEKDW